MARTNTDGSDRTARIDRASGTVEPLLAGTRDEPTPDASLSGVDMPVRSEVGRTIAGRYRITSIIGEGGMGIVVRAHDTRIERDVAIKLVRADCVADDKFLIRFRRELDITSHLRHPSTIRVFEHGETEDGRPYMVMELLRGDSLADRLEQGPIPEMEALQFARQIAESLSEAHEHGVFHRDLKPDNIFIETVGVSRVVKVLDFGIAGGRDTMRLTQAGEVFGTPQYMSPEQCNGLPLDHRTDIYSLGVILYEMIEGRPPFSAETPMATMLKHVRAKVPPPRTASRETAKLLAHALRKERTKRVQSAGEFAAMIGECMGAVRARAEGREPPAATPERAVRSAAERSGLVALPLRSAPARAATGRQAGAPVHVSPAATPLPAVPLVDHDRSRWIAGGVGLATLALVLVVVFGGLGRSSPVNPGQDVTTPAAEEPAAAAANATATEPAGAGRLPHARALVRTNIAGAQVKLDGADVCLTPCEIEVPVGDGKVHEVRVTKPGHIDVVANWQPGSVSEPLPPLPDMKPLP